MARPLTHNAVRAILFAGCFGLVVLMCAAQNSTDAYPATPQSNPHPANSTLKDSTKYDDQSSTKPQSADDAAKERKAYADKIREN